MNEAVCEGGLVFLGVGFFAAFCENVILRFGDIATLHFNKFGLISNCGLNFKLQIGNFKLGSRMDYVLTDSTS